jgi:hypothetical protein
MERWTVGTNNVYKFAVITKQEGVWVLFFIEWLSQTICNILHRLPSIKLPSKEVTKTSFLGCDTLEEGESMPLSELYGDFQGFWCWKVDNPILRWCESKYKATSIEVDLEDTPEEWHSWDEEDEEEEGDHFEGETQEIYEKFLFLRDEEREMSKLRAEWKEKVFESLRGK